MLPHSFALPRPYESLEEEGGFSAFSSRALDVCETATTYRPRDPAESVLYRVVAAELESFLEEQRLRNRHIPRFVERELRSFLECGILAHGFIRVHCDRCRQDRLVPFSCKARGVCPSCGGRRMADTAAHLVDRVFPEVPIRQGVSVRYSQVPRPPGPADSWPRLSQDLPQSLSGCPTSQSVSSLPFDTIAASDDMDE